MRVISQKGMPVVIDLPYEYIAVSQSMKEPSCIIAYDITARDGFFFRMARYSTPEKAEKAMQKLHNCYQEWAEGVVFHFPSEDEIR